MTAPRLTEIPSWFFHSGSQYTDQTVAVTENRVLASGTDDAAVIAAAEGAGESFILVWVRDRAPDLSPDDTPAEDRHDARCVHT